MSLIIHYCNQCGHRDIDRNREGVCTSAGCRCATPRDGFSEPVVIPTFETLTGRRIDAITQAGTRWPVAETGNPLPGAPTLCSCRACKALYAEASA